MLAEGTDYIGSQSARKGGDYLVIASRGYTQDEILKINKAFDSNKVNSINSNIKYFQIDNQIDVNESTTFKDANVLREIEKRENGYLKGLFVQENEDDEINDQSDNFISNESNDDQ